MQLSSPRKQFVLRGSSELLSAAEGRKIGPRTIHRFPDSTSRLSPNAGQVRQRRTRCQYSIACNDTEYVECSVCSWTRSAEAPPPSTRTSLCNLTHFYFHKCRSKTLS